MTLNNPKLPDKGKAYRRYLSRIRGDRPSNQGDFSFFHCEQERFEFANGFKDEEIEPLLYTVDDDDEIIVSLLKDFLWKIIRSPIVSSVHIAPLGKMLQVLDSIPEVSEEPEIEITLCKEKTRTEADRFWRVALSGLIIEASSGGYVYEEGVGGDSFSTFEWDLSPYPSILFDGSERRSPFAAEAFLSELESIDFNQGNYSLLVSYDGQECS
jgi:hypothetical protein